ncbi:hypothetical protein [Clostridium sp.]|uniref:hypothetical protein n=1 Tax=Clostridium sp. TaxID=1506 RepID=UPI003F2E48A6
MDEIIEIFEQSVDMMINILIVVVFLYFSFWTIFNMFTIMKLVSLVMITSIGFSTIHFLINRLIKKHKEI